MGEIITVKFGAERVWDKSQQQIGKTLERCCAALPEVTRVQLTRQIVGLLKKLVEHPCCEFQLEAKISPRTSYSDREIEDFAQCIQECIDSVAEQQAAATTSHAVNAVVAALPMMLALASKRDQC